MQGAEISIEGLERGLISLEEQKITRLLKSGFPDLKRSDSSWRKFQWMKNRVSNQWNIHLNGGIEKSVRKGILNLEFQNSISRSPRNCTALWGQMAYIAPAKGKVIPTSRPHTQVPGDLSREFAERLMDQGNVMDEKCLNWMGLLNSFNQR